MKRSAHVALLLMGTAAVGGTAYSMMPNENCSPDRPAIAGPNGTAVDCTRRSSSSSSGGGSSHFWGSRTSFFGSNSSSSSSSSSSSHASGGDGGSSVSRGGFGSFAHSVASHFSRGG